MLFVTPDRNGTHDNSNNLRGFFELVQLAGH